MSKKLLVIELENETAVPKVIYKGEEITKKVSVAFDWETETDVTKGSMNLDIEYYEPRKDGPPLVKRTGISK